MEMESTYSTIVPDFSGLPEDIISHVISLTTPRDAWVASAVCHAFLSAADSDATWRNFLPSDYASLLSEAAHPVKYDSIKELYMHLCDHPLLIGGGLMSFQLERSTGAKIFMISSRDLPILSGNNPTYWDWIALPDSRFRECAVLRSVRWLFICGMINGKILTPNTPYASYLVFKLTEDANGLGKLQETKVFHSGNMVSQHLVCVNPQWVISLRTNENVILPIIREDVWLEVELGTFHTGDGIHEELITMMFKESDYRHVKSGLIVQGIEVRPISSCKIKTENV